MHVLYPASDSATSSNIRGPDRNFWERARSHLEDTLEDLWEPLDDWCASPLEPRTSEPFRSAQYPNSDARGTSMDTTQIGAHEATRPRFVWGVISSFVLASLSH